MKNPFKKKHKMTPEEFIKKNSPQKIAYFDKAPENVDENWFKLDPAEVTIFSNKPTKEEDEPKLTLLQKLAEIQKEVDYIKKDSNVSFGQTNFDYVSLNGVLNMIRPVMAKHGVLLVPQLQEIITDEMFKTNKGATQYRIRATFDLIWTDTDTGETQKFNWIGSAENDYTRVLNAAATSARRNFLLNFFNIVSTDNMEDAEAMQRPENRHPTELKQYLRPFYQKVEKGIALEYILKELNDKLAIDNMSLGKKNTEYLTQCFLNKQKELGA